VVGEVTLLHAAPIKSAALGWVQQDADTKSVPCDIHLALPLAEITAVQNVEVLRWPSRGLVHLLPQCCLPQAVEAAPAATHCQPATSTPLLQQQQNPQRQSQMPELLINPRSSQMVLQPVHVPAAISPYVVWMAYSMTMNALRSVLA
jgi:hypothetical protein